MCRLLSPEKSFTSPFNPLTYSANNDFALKTAIQHRAFYHIDTKKNYTYQSCYDVIKKICQALGARILFSGSQYWFIQINQYANNPASLRYFKYSALGVQTSGTFTDDFTLSNVQGNLGSSDLMRLSGGKWTYEYSTDETGNDITEEEA